MLRGFVMTAALPRKKSVAMEFSSVVVVLLGALCGCTSTTIDQVRHGYTGINQGEHIVILGRRHSSDDETEVDFIRCVGDYIAAQEGAGIEVVPESQFADSLYPWFEPRTAPLRMNGLKNLLRQADIAARINELGIRYMVWIDGSTQKTSSVGSIACSVGPGGCLGFGMWENESEYEATVWDLANLKAVGQVRADAKGTSYMPAVVVPIPLIARVKSGACKGMGEQLSEFLSPDGQIAGE